MKRIVALSIISTLVLWALADDTPRKPLHQDQQKLQNEGLKLQKNGIKQQDEPKKKNLTLVELF